ncbi:MAG: hypothetical protein K2O18_00310, partial [Oscillospiraceae bacterium]|nr:hypothetical protein [Oscillospiraceae bacterium]
QIYIFHTSYSTIVPFAFLAFISEIIPSELLSSYATCFIKNNQFFYFPNLRYKTTAFQAVIAFSSHFLKNAYTLVASMTGKDTARPNNVIAEREIIDLTQSEFLEIRERYRGIGFMERPHKWMKKRTSRLRIDSS